jgi:hypothetical protein
MHEKILHEMRARVRRGNLVITVHGRQEMYNDGLFAVDVKNCLLKGKIFERQWDVVVMKPITKLKQKEPSLEQQTCAYCS